MLSESRRLPMNQSMVASPDRSRSTTPDVHVSPELALVDPELAEWARDRLPSPAEQAARARISSRLRAESTTLATTAVPPLRRQATGARRKRSAVIVSAAVVLASALLVADPRVEFARTPASADTVGSTPSDSPPPTAGQESVTPGSEMRVIPETPTTPAQTRQPPQPATTPSGPSPSRESTNGEPRVFAWAPAANARAYHVELFRGSTKVYAADTKASSITIPTRWRFDGRDQALEPGSYRWYVWPYTSGSRALRAIVQAQLTVPRR
jgi:hypothetical protein